AILGLALLLPLPLAACGKRGPPVAPEYRLPAAVQDLQAAVVGNEIRLTWTLPRMRVDRSPLKEVVRTEVYRRVEDGAPDQPIRPAILTFGGLFGPPPGVPGFDRVANITVAEPERAEIQGNLVTYLDAQDLTFGQRYTYVVIALDEKGRPSPPSNRVVVALAAAPVAPPRLNAQPGDAQVRLTWEAPATLADGSPAPQDLVYDVLRGTTPGTPAGRPLNLEPITTPQYVDLAVQNDVTYHYVVRARLASGGAQSIPSPVASATPEDATPPAQPRGLVAVVAGSAIRLAWEAVPDADVAGYLVYRSTTAGRGHTPLMPAPQAGTTYADTDVRPGQAYYYVVTAVDRSRRANESVPSAEATATLR
ncbi:MAG: fibronectin type III domain-containing protein, partial [Candidatus Rokuibacteriota bacterium]